MSQVLYNIGVSLLHARRPSVAFDILVEVTSQLWKLHCIKLKLITIKGCRSTLSGPTRLVSPCWVLPDGWTGKTFMFLIFSENWGDNHLFLLSDGQLSHFSCLSQFLNSCGNFAAHTTPVVVTAIRIVQYVYLLVKWFNPNSNNIVFLVLMWPFCSLTIPTTFPQLLVKQERLQKEVQVMLTYA